jgi:processive 1,2-diacylglycerol beta-glucosyltransferase
VELLLRRKEEGRLPQPVYCVVTDYVAHTFWLTSGLDGYFVATDLTRDLMAERGVAPSHIYVSGIPVNPNIAEPKDCTAVRAAHGYATNEPLITLFGGGIPIPRVRRMVTELLKSNIRGTLVVASGRNEGLAQAIAKLSSGPQLRLQVLEHISYVDDLIAASDLVITKPGGLIVSEVLARGTPMLLIDPIPGQEEWNADYVATTGAGVQVRMPESVARATQSLLHNPARLLALRESARQAGRPRAALDIAEHVLQALR